VHAEVHVPATQNGSDEVHSELDLQPVPGAGAQTPLGEQVVPLPHVGAVMGPGVQVTKQLPSSQTSPLAHWLENLQTELPGSHDPATQESPLGQSLLVVQGQGPLVPPHVTQALS
jgi:hypothetical protein